MLTDYLPIVMMAVLAAVFAIASLLASSLLRPDRPNPVKLSAYECGNDPVRLPRGERFSVKFYVVAMLFIIFDIETIFLFPWAVTFRRLGLFGLIEMAVFIGLVFVAYVYIWRKGGFDWAHHEVSPNVTEDVVERERELFLSSDREVATLTDTNEREGTAHAR
jgi:NADH-quinone oxidoreductase subunit A